MHLSKRLFLASILIACSSASAYAGQLIYSPTNPGFGGNPNYFDYLVGMAQIQNQHLPEQSGGGGSSAAPQINFPPITIDLGGVAGAGGTTPGITPAQ